MAKWAASSGSAEEKDVDCQSLGMEIEKKKKKFLIFSSGAEKPFDLSLVASIFLHRISCR